MTEYETILLVPTVISVPTTSYTYIITDTDRYTVFTAFKGFF